MGNSASIKHKWSYDPTVWCILCGHTIHTYNHKFLECPKVTDFFIQGLIICAHKHLGLDLYFVRHRMDIKIVIEVLEPLPLASNGSLVKNNNVETEGVMEWSL